MAWPFAGQSTDVATDDENSRERLIEMGGVAIEEVPLPDAGDSSQPRGRGRESRLRLGGCACALKK